jgi:hypothetical protein
LAETGTIPFLEFLAGPRRGGVSGAGVAGRARDGYPVGQRLVIPAVATAGKGKTYVRENRVPAYPLLHVASFLVAMGHSLGARFGIEHDHSPPETLRLAEHIVASVSSSDRTTDVGRPANSR